LAEYLSNITTRREDPFIRADGRLCAEQGGHHAHHDRRAAQDPRIQLRLTITRLFAIDPDDAVCL
jgi:hypothetical protein